MNCHPVLRGTRNHPHQALLKKRPHFGWLEAAVGSGDRVRRCLSEDPPRAAYSAVPKVSWNVGWR